MTYLRSWLCVAALVAMVHPASAAIRITEWMYNGAGAGNIGEFVEFTNLGPAAVDFTGWSFDDSSRAPGSQSLSAFGLVASGESVVFTDSLAADFRTNWNLPAAVKIVGGNANNLGRSDEINLYDAANALVDRLAYGDETFTGSIRTQNKSGNPNGAAALGANNPLLWSLSAVGDAFGSTTSVAGEIGNPGSYPIPEPATLTLAAASLLVIFGQRRRA
jgi:predicted extracellular nuclease